MWFRCKSIEKKRVRGKVFIRFGLEVRFGLFCGSVELPQGLKPLLVRSVSSAKAEALAYPEAKAERFSVQLESFELRQLRGETDLFRCEV